MVHLDEGGRGHLEALVLAPPAALRPAIEHFWIRRTPHRRPVWRIVPDTSAHVIFTMTDDGRRGAKAACRVVGARSTFADIDVVGRRLTIGARLRAGLLPMLIRMSAAELADRAVTVDAIFGAAGASLLLHLADLGPEDGMRVLARFLESRMSDPRASRLRSIADPLATASRVGSLAAAFGVSSRSLHARMIETVGLSPKRALRVERIHRALRASAAGRSLAQSALDAGFSDQSHLTREARALLGESPGHWTVRSRASDSFKTAR